LVISTQDITLLLTNLAVTISSPQAVCEVSKLRYVSKLSSLPPLLVSGRGGTISCTHTHSLAFRIIESDVAEEH
jgi:hypothetical protein